LQGRHTNAEADFAEALKYDTNLKAAIDERLAQIKQQLVAKH
jgi:hypothetical protein